MRKQNTADWDRWAREGLQAQRANGNWPMSVREIGRAWGMSENPTRYRLSRLVEAGLVETRPYGNNHGVQYRFVEIRDG